MKKFSLIMALLGAILCGCKSKEIPRMTVKIDINSNLYDVPIYNGTPISMAGSGQATVDWGDGKSDSFTLSGEITDYRHTYIPGNHYTITVTGTNVIELVINEIGIPYSELELDVSKNTELTGLYCYKHKLTSLDVSRNTKLTALDCHSNQLTSLDVSKNTNLTELDCSYNDLTNLDISKNKKLKFLVCRSNQLTASALNSLFKTLPDNPDNSNGGGLIVIDNNPGADDCNRTIAADKGWVVD